MNEAERLAEVLRLIVGSPSLSAAQLRGKAADALRAYERCNDELWHAVHRAHAANRKIAVVGTDVRGYVTTITNHGFIVQDREGTAWPFGFKEGFVLAYNNEEDQ